MDAVSSTWALLGSHIKFLATVDRTSWTAFSTSDNDFIVSILRPQLQETMTPGSLGINAKPCLRRHFANLHLPYMIAQALISTEIQSQNISWFMRKTKKKDSKCVIEIFSLRFTTAIVTAVQIMKQIAQFHGPKLIADQNGSSFEWVLSFTIWEPQFFLCWWILNRVNLVVAILTTSCAAYSLS